MQILSLAINGQPLDSLDAASVKLSVTNVSPISMSGDSVAFSASVKVPRTWNNDKVFSALQFPGVHTANYNADLRVSSLPFRYLAKSDDAPVSFYAKVSMNATDYTLNLIENEPKWNSLEAPLRIIKDSRLLSDNFAGITVALSSLQGILADNFPGFTGEFPAVYPCDSEYNYLPNADKYKPCIVQEGYNSINWQEDVCTGTTNLVPTSAIKGDNGWTYKDTEFAIDNTDVSFKAQAFDGVPPANSSIGFYLDGGNIADLRVLFEWTGETIPSTKPAIYMFSGTRTPTQSPLETYNFSRELSPRVWEYRRSASINPAYYPLDSTRRFYAAGYESTNPIKFPDGYTPEELIMPKNGNFTISYGASLRPAYDTVSGNQIKEYFYKDVKTLVDSVCTALHWRKIYRGGKLRIEPIVARELRDRITSAYHNAVVDWSDKFISIDTVSTPDEFANQYVAKLGNIPFSYAAGAGTVNFVKDAYAAAVPYHERVYWSIVVRSNMPFFYFTPRFDGYTPPSTWQGFVDNTYYYYINRHFRMFDPRVEVKVKARLSYEDVRNLRLDTGYYFKQLGGTYYLKNLGEFDVTKGDCKLTLWKLNLTD